MIAKWITRRRRVVFVTVQKKVVFRNIFSCVEVVLQEHYILLEGKSGAKDCILIPSDCRCHLLIDSSFVICDIPDFVDSTELGFDGIPLFCFLRRKSSLGCISLPEFMGNATGSSIRICYVLMPHSMRL
jgi:hypothetical protein